MANKEIDTTDPRWGGYCPWFLRHSDFSGTGDLGLFFDRLEHRVWQLFNYNEAGVGNSPHFAHTLESKSLRRFKYDERRRKESPAEQISKYFNIDLIKREYTQIAQTKKFPITYQPIIDRLGVLEILLLELPKKKTGFSDFVNDIRKYLAEACIMLDIDSETYEIKLLDEPLLQREVIDKLLPRLASVSPERAKEFSAAYHDLILGEKKFDDIFISAFKTLEALVREITSDISFEFKKPNLKKYFPKLHPTIHDTITKLAAHRGDEGGHGRDAPESHEMRYLLFSICNIALLLLDYQP